MGTLVVQFPVATAGGSSILIEIDDPITGNRPVARKVAEMARQSLEAAFAEVIPGVDALMVQVQGLAARPDQFSLDEVGLEFGVKFTAEAGAVIAKTSMEGNITIKLKWSPPGKAK